MLEFQTSTKPLPKDVPDMVTKMENDLLEWAVANNSFVYRTPSGRYFALFTEPDYEAPVMQFIGSSLPRAWVALRRRKDNILV